MVGKQAYISPDHATLEVLLTATERTEAVVTLETGIPVWPMWSIRVPIDDEDGDTILDMAVQALAEDFLYFLISMNTNEELAKSIYALIMLAYTKLQGTDPIKEGPTAIFSVRIPLDDVFVQGIQESVVTAAVKRPNTSVKQVKKLEITRNPPKAKALPQAKQIIQKYKNRSLKGQPRPLYLLVYDFNGNPMGVQRL